MKIPAYPPLGVKKRGTGGLSARIRRSTNGQVGRCGERAFSARIRRSTNGQVGTCGERAFFCQDKDRQMQREGLFCQYKGNKGTKSQIGRFKERSFSVRIRVYTKEQAIEWGTGGLVCQDKEICQRTIRSLRS